MLGSISAQACDGTGNQTIGSICMTAANFCPAPSYLPADGRSLSISSNQALFSLIGSTFGGDGRTSFKLPDLRGRLPLGAGAGPGLPVNKLGYMGGTPEIAIPSTALPTHTHTATFAETSPIDVKVPASSRTSGNTIAPDATHSYLAASPTGMTSAAIWADGMEGSTSLSGVTATGGGGNVTVQPSGSGQPFPYQPPVASFTYCIAAEGIYPQRP
jgi:microcystin-dependent protein